MIVMKKDEKMNERRRGNVLPRRSDTPEMSDEDGISDFWLENRSPIYLQQGGHFPLEELLCLLLVVVS